MDITNLTLNSCVPKHLLKHPILLLKKRYCVTQKIRSTFPKVLSKSVKTCFAVDLCVHACTHRVCAFIYVLSCAPQKQARQQQTMPAAEHMGCPVCIHVAPEPPFTPEAKRVPCVVSKGRQLHQHTHLTCVLG